MDGRPIELGNCDLSFVEETIYLALKTLAGHRTSTGRMR
jgi:hypothetical protein